MGFFSSVLFILCGVFYIRIDASKLCEQVPFEYICSNPRARAFCRTEEHLTMEDCNGPPQPADTTANAALLRLLPADILNDPGLLELLSPKRVKKSSIFTPPSHEESAPKVSSSIPEYTISMKDLNVTSIPLDASSVPLELEQSVKTFTRLKKREIDILLELWTLNIPSNLTDAQGDVVPYVPTVSFPLDSSCVTLPPENICKTLEQALACNAVAYCDYYEWKGQRPLANTTGVASQPKRFYIHSSCVNYYADVDICETKEKAISCEALEYCLHFGLLPSDESSSSTQASVST